jgi:hypothetical protein
MSDEQPDDEVAYPEIDQAEGEPAFDPERFKAELQGQVEERIKGLQRLVSRKDEEIQNLRAGLSDLSEDERDEQLVTSAQRIAELEAELAAQRWQTVRPDDFAAYQRLLAAPDDAAALDLIAELRAGSQPDPGSQVGDTDPNNPWNLQGSVTGMPGSGGMTDELSMELLRRFSPGSRR